MIFSKKDAGLWGQASFPSARPLVFWRLTSQPLPELSRTCHVFPLTRPLATQPAEQADLRPPQSAMRPGRRVHPEYARYMSRC